MITEELQQEVQHVTYQSRDELISAVAGGVRVKYLFFWGHHSDRDEHVGPGCLSQWWSAPFTVDNITYPTAEHWMMAAKARLFGDDIALEKVLTARSPGAAKAAGRTVRNFDESLWEHHRFQIVEEGNYAKFTQNDDLRTYLLATGTRVLVEASPVDRVWGIGREASDPLAADPLQWRGLNLLGFAVASVRDRLRRTP